MNGIRITAAQGVRIDGDAIALLGQPRQLSWWRRWNRRLSAGWLGVAFKACNLALVLLGVWKLLELT